MKTIIGPIILGIALLASGCDRAEKTAPKVAIDDRNHPEMRVDAPLRAGYSKLYSCQFQTEMMAGGPQKPAAGYGERIAATIKTDPAAGDKCLKALSDRQGLTPATPAAPAKVK